MANKPKLPVGYGRPPVERRFEKGVSGNPKGRPKKTPRQAAKDALLLDFEKIIARESCREIKVQDGEKTATITMYEATVRRLHIDAAKGVPSAISKVLKLRQDLETSQYEQQKELVFAVLERKAKWADMVAESEQTGRPLPTAPAPHPDDIEFNYGTGRIHYNGPKDPQEERGWKHVAQQASAYQAEAKRLRKMAKRDPDIRAQLEDDAAWNAKMGAMMTAYFPSEKVRRCVGFDLIRWRQDEPLCQEFEAMAERGTGRNTSRKGRPRRV